MRHYQGWGIGLEEKLKTNESLSIQFDARCQISDACARAIAVLILVYEKQDHVAFDGTEQSRLIQAKIKEQMAQKKTLPEPLSQNHFSFSSLLALIGKSASRFGQTATELLTFFGYVIVRLYETFRRHRKIPLTSFVYHLDQVGFQATPIIALISFLIGMVLSYQGINQLARFGAEIYTIDFLTIGVFREIGVLLTAVVVAGRSASSFTAQIGTMSLNQEIDAMRMMQLDPVIYLVLPRMIALLIALPLLVFLSDMMALIGGMLTTYLVIDLTPTQFINYLQKAFSLNNFWVGMSKAPLFSLLIGLVGCFRGMQVRGSAESVGKMTTASVVEAIFLVIVANALMSLVFSYLKV